VGLTVLRSPQLVIVGAGPAGLAAAEVAGQLNIETLVIDEQSNAGGQIYRGLKNSSDTLVDALGSEYSHGRALLAALDHPSVELSDNSTVWQISDDGTVYFTSPKGSSPVRGEYTILATGAIERPMPFPGWTLPGVMTVGGIQIALKTAGLIPDGQLVLAGSGPLLLLLVRQIMHSGGHVSAVVETTPMSNSRAALKYLPGLCQSGKTLVDGLSLIKVLRKHKIPHYSTRTCLRYFRYSSWRCS